MRLFTKNSKQSVESHENPSLQHIKMMQPIHTVDKTIVSAWLRLTSAEEVRHSLKGGTGISQTKVLKVRERFWMNRQDTL